ncbi:7-carboxy-7-deazaguanine synthase QueE [Myxococcota bacterium]|nr:7-carboxy-7-deazaguanine synthase QueE [Myxococcota bacterium]
MRLRITEVFHSIQGESTFAGRPSVFVRLTGCDLRCAWCDSTYTFSGGSWIAVEALVDQVLAFGTPLVCVTGGEPLLQPDVHGLMTRLLDAGRTVTLETGGHRDVSPVDPRVHRIVDWKPPASGEVDRNRWENLDVLTTRDEIKCVVADRADYEWARAQVRSRGAAARVGAIHFSPVHGRLAAVELAGWILEDRLPVRLQIQLHKHLWGADARGV